MERFKKICKLEYGFMAYNVFFLLYALAAVAKTFILTGNYSLLAFASASVVAALAGYVCWQKKVRPSLLHGLTLALFAWLVLSCWYHSAALGSASRTSLVLFFCMSLPCFLIFLGFSAQQYLAQWRWIAVGFNAVVTALSCVGIYCALFGKTFDLPFVANVNISLDGIMLNVIAHHNNSAQYIGFALLLALFMVLTCRKLWVRALFGVDFAILWVTLSLTYSRTAFIAFSLAVAVALCYYLWHAKKLQLPQNKMRSIAVRLALCAVVCGGGILVGYLGMSTANDVISSIRVQYQTSIAEATQTVAVQTIAAKTTAQPSAIIQLSAASTDAASSDALTPQELEDLLTQQQEDRSLSNMGTFTARLKLWSYSLTIFAQSPDYQLFGTSPAGVSPLLALASENRVYVSSSHAHNVYVQVLLAIGVPGFLVFIALWGSALFFAIKHFFMPDGQFATHCFPLLLLIAFSFIGLQEALMLATVTSLLAPAFFMAVACIVWVQQAERA